MIAARLLLGALVGAGFLLAARAAVDRLGAPASILRRWLAEAIVALSLVTLVFFALLTGGLFRVGAMVACGAGLAALAFAAVGRARLASTLRADRRALRRLGAALLARPGRARLAALAGLLALPGVVRTVLTPPLGWDALTYHLLKAQIWVRTGTWHDMTGPGPWNVYAERPAGASALRAVGMLLVGEDSGATVLDPLFWILSALALLVAARALGAKEPWGSWGAAFVASAAPVRLALGSGYSEPLLLGVLAAAVACALPLLRRGRSGRADAVAAGAALGLTVGVSPATLPVVAATGGALAILLAWRAADRGGALVALCLAVAAASALAGPWYLRTTLRLGLPLSPLDATVGPLRVGAPVPEAFWYEQWIESPHDPRAEVVALAKIFTLPWVQGPALGVLALLPLLALVARYRAILHAGRSSLLVAALAISSAALFWSPAFTVVRRYWAASSSRFLLPALVGVVLLSLAGRRAAEATRGPYLRFLIAATLFQLGRAIPVGVGPAERWALLASTLALLPVVFLLASPGGARRALGAAALLVWGAAVTGARSALRWTFVGESHAIHPAGTYWAGAAESLDDGRPHVVAITSGRHQSVDNWLAYSFGGSRFQNALVYVPTTRSGQFVPWSARSVALEVRLGDGAAWLRRLRERGVTHVMSFVPRSMELVWMEQRPDLFRRVTGLPSAWGLFELRGREETSSRPRTGAPGGTGGGSAPEEPRPPEAGRASADS